MLTEEKKKELQEAIKQVDLDDMFFNSDGIDGVLGDITQEAIQKTIGEEDIRDIPEEEYVEMDDYLEPLAAQKVIDAVKVYL